MRISTITIGAVGALCLSLAGCAEPAQEAAMVPQRIAPAAAGNPYRAAVSRVTAYGGDETNPMWTSEISQENFQQALEMSLRKAGLFSDKGRFAVRADILTVKQPMGGFDLKVTMTVRYNVTDAKGRMRFDRTITSTYTALLEESFVGVDRLKKANEGAARANIAQFLRALGTAAQGSDFAWMS